jgi:phosphoribosylformylglycinamidine synthase subunit PurS
MFQAKVYISIKKGILDPQGKAVSAALQSLGYKDTAKARVGKFITLDIASNDKEKASAELKEMCDRLLINPQIEEYTFDLIEVSK